MRQTKYDICNAIWKLVLTERDKGVNYDLMVLHMLSERYLKDGRITVRSMKRRLAFLAKLWVDGSDGLTDSQRAFVELVTN